ncbi:MAG: hypothetical protein GY943_02195, partial [Chloroflexi bacterium]|nr:hypothetical protein [Chloroflexota bacterium]
MKLTKQNQKIFLRVVRILLLTFLFLIVSGVSAAPNTVINFEGLAEGLVIEELSTGNGISGDPVSGFITVYGLNPRKPNINHGAIFDSTCAPSNTPVDCSGDDDDLFKPQLGNTLIINIPVRNVLDGIIPNPNDDDRIGMLIDLDYSNWGDGTVYIESLDVLDVESIEAGAEIQLYAGGINGTLLATIPIPPMGDNQYETIDIGVSGVDFMRVLLNGSGAIDNIRLTSETPDTATVGDRVWQDDNGDGVQDADEPGIPGVTVNLTDCAGNILATDITDANGNYLFDGLDADTYCVEIDETTLPDNLQQTFEKDGTLDGDTEQPLNPGDEILDVDFGYQPLPRFTLGDTVWYDQNQNGIQDGNEPGYPGVIAELFDNASCSGTAVSSTTTNTTGFYQFTDLLAGDYCIQFSNIPAGWSISPTDQGGDDTADSDANGNAQITNINLTADDPDEDMGV